MKLHSLYIKEYKILKDFRIDFNNPISVMIGMNGSGKSTVLEALAEIFSDIYIGLEHNKIETNVTFEYHLEYSILHHNGDYIRVSLDKKWGDKLEVNIVIDTTGNDTAKEYKGIASDFFPNRVITYYSGWNNKMSIISYTHVSNYERRLRTNNTDNNLPKLKFLNIEKLHFDMLLCALFSFEYNDDLNAFFSKNIPTIDIENIGICIWLQKPSWGIGDIKNFYGTKGELLQFLNVLKDNAKTFKEDNDFLYFGINEWRKVKDFYGNERVLFYFLNALDTAGLLHELLPNYLKDTSEQNAVWDEISEGERQLLLVRAINELLIEENTLCLFDEPDVYLHPKWQGEFIKNISEGNTENAQYVITTHSTVMLSNLKQGDLFRMKNGKAQRIESGYYGKDYGDNLENYFEVAGRNEEATVDLANLFQLIDEEKFEKATQVLENLQLKYPNEPELTRAQTLITLLQDDDED